jgi:hypothetical protein
MNERSDVLTGSADVTERVRSDRRLAAVTLILCLACTSSSSSRATAAAGAQPSPPVSSTASPRIAEGQCPVTRPVAREEVPQAVVNAVFGDYVGPPPRNVGHWYGNGALWVELPTGSEVVEPHGELGEKFPWVRLARGYLKIRGRRMDGHAPPAEASASRGYGLTGFQASGIVFPTTGCWQITGTIGVRELTVIVDVRRA